jgi:hypothetical protein
MLQEMGLKKKTVHNISTKKSEHKRRKYNCKPLISDQGMGD